MTGFLSTFSILSSLDIDLFFTLFLALQKRIPLYYAVILTVTLYFVIFYIIKFIKGKSSD